MSGNLQKSIKKQKMAHETTQETMNPVGLPHKIKYNFLSLTNEDMKTETESSMPVELPPKNVERAAEAQFWHVVLQT